MKVLFFIHDLGQGGAEKVLVNLVNHMDPARFDVSVMALFGGGVNEQFLREHVKYRAVFPKMIPGNSHLMKLFSPRQLHRMFIKDRYDVEIAFLEGPDARIISGCPVNDTELVSWIHVEQKTTEKASFAFRSFQEAENCYRCFDKIICVSKTVASDFSNLFETAVSPIVLYNTVESKRIYELSKEHLEEKQFRDDVVKLIAIGTLKASKGFTRLIRVAGRLRDSGYIFHLSILGIGPEQKLLEKCVSDLKLSEYVTFYGYQINPYKYLADHDLFICSSYAEGFSTAATEALIVGTPVCTTEVSGMREMLGDSEYGLIVDNSEDALYEGIKRLLDDPALLKHYREAARERGKAFQTEATVRAVEDMLIEL